MIPKFLAISLMTGAAFGQQTVCDLFRELASNDGKQLIVTGELLISKDLAALGAIDCDYRYISELSIRPTAISLRPSPTVRLDQLTVLKNAAAEADRLRLAGKTVSASGSFAGRLRVAPVSDFPAELIFESVENVKVEALSDAEELPVIPICELFQNLSAWRDKRVAVRGETFSTGESSGLTGRCKGAFVTNGYRWPVALSYAGPAYSSQRTAAMERAKSIPRAAKGEGTLRGRNNVVKIATYVGHLRMRSDYQAYCRAGGDYLTNGFGHLGFAVAELVVESVRDEEWTPRTAAEQGDDDSSECPSPDKAARCAMADSLRSAIANSCVEKFADLLASGGIDSKDGNDSAALNQAILVGNEAAVRLLIEKGAPVNPARFTLWPPLGEAAHRSRVKVMKVLLAAGADPEAKDGHGVSYLPTYGFFNLGVAKALLDGGAKVDARDDQGRTALMRAAGYGYEGAVKLLIDHHADLNLTDNAGWTALMHAAGGKYVEAIPHLLSNHADLYARDRDGHTALDTARESKNQVAVEMLSSAMDVKR